jgi:hypothetical protein
VENSHEGVGHFSVGGGVESLNYLEDGMIVLGRKGKGRSSMQELCAKSTKTGVEGYRRAQDPGSFIHPQNCTMLVCPVSIM